MLPQSIQLILLPSFHDIFTLWAETTESGHQIRFETWHDRLDAPTPFTISATIDQSTFQEMLDLALPVVDIPLPPGAFKLDGVSFKLYILGGDPETFVHITNPEINPSATKLVHRFFDLCLRQIPDPKLVAYLIDFASNFSYQVPVQYWEASAKHLPPGALWQPKTEAERKAEDEQWRINFTIHQQMLSWYHQYTSKSKQENDSNAPSLIYYHEVSKPDPETKANDPTLSHHHEVSKPDPETKANDAAFTLYHDAKHLENARVTLAQLPVYLLQIDSNSFVLNTTYRFIYVTHGQIHPIPYTQFKAHLGFVPPLTTQDDNEAHNTKIQGHLAPFQIQTTDDQIHTWQLPTGPATYAFWNVTKKCVLVGKKLKLGLW